MVLFKDLAFFRDLDFFGFSLDLDLGFFRIGFSVFSGSGFSFGFLWIWTLVFLTDLDFKLSAWILVYLVLVFSKNQEKKKLTDIGF